MQKITLYTAGCIGNPKNCIYTNKVVFASLDDFRKAVSYDHVFVKYRDNYRSVSGFVSSNCIAMECDNDHSDNATDWVTPTDVAATFVDVPFYVSYSKSHNKVKGSRLARPHFHIVFPITTITDAKQYENLKTKVLQRFPYFDKNAVDVARFFFGVEEPKVEFFPGNTLVSEFIENGVDIDVIPEGSRNSTLSRFAGRIVKRYGKGTDAYEMFLAEAKRCAPPLEDEELDAVWRSAESFADKVSSENGYIPPEIYNSEVLLKPRDFSDVGQAEVLSREYAAELRYSPSTDYIRYNGMYWEESKSKTQAVAQELTSRQLEEAQAEITKANKLMNNTGATALITGVGKSKALPLFNKEQSTAYNTLSNALAYQSYVIKRRESKSISATLKEARPMIEIGQDELDTHEYLLNTPKGTYNLRKGIDGLREHRAEDFITKITSVSPGTEVSEEWMSALDTFFCSDKELIKYVQLIAGLATIGKVNLEALIIAYGDGKNGKSTFWNVLSRILGTYSGNISADTLTVGCRRNVKPELAEARGKRLLIAAELEEGTRLSTANVKQFCSTDEIFAEKKYKDPFSYTPTHTLVLYTNHLPKVGASDSGTWRRLIVIPFNATISENSDIKNYADYLYENAGESILAWMIEGARMVIDKNFRFDAPLCVQQAISKYMQDNDWLGHFIDDCCDVDESYKEKSSDLYSEYRNYCITMGEFARSTSDFYTALENAGYKKHRTKECRYILGLRIKDKVLPCISDFRAA